MAAVEEDQVGNRFHGPDLGGGDQQPIGEHHPAAGAAVAGLLVVDTVGGDVNDSIEGSVELVDDVHGLFTTDRLLAVVAVLPQHVHHRLRFVSGTFEAIEGFGSLAGGAIGEDLVESLGGGVADHIGALFERLAHLGAITGRLQLPHHSRREGQGLVVGQQQLPGKVGGVAVEHQHHAVHLPGLVLEVMGHQQLEQGSGEILHVGGLPDRGLHQGLHQSWLPLMQGGFRACPLTEVGEPESFGEGPAWLGGQGFGTLGRGEALFALVRIGHLEPRPVGHTLAGIESLAETFPLAELPVGFHAHAVAGAIAVDLLGHPHQGPRSRGGDVEVELHDLQLGDPHRNVRPRFGELMVGRQHPTHEGGHRILHTDVGGGVVAEQQGGKRRFDSLGGLARLPIHQLEQVAEAAHPHGFRERDRAQFAVGAEPDHHRSAGSAPSPFLGVVGEQNNSGRALRSGIEAEAMAHREFTAHELAVDQGLGPGDGILQVVTHHHRLGDEAQIHGRAAHLQARGRPGLERLALPTAEQAEGHFFLGGIGNGAGVIDHRCHG